MGKEHDHEQGRSWIGPFIVSAIDQALQSKLPKGREVLAGHCVNLIDMLIAPLVIEKVPDEILEHLKIEFTQPKNEDEINGQTSKDLQQIKAVLTIEFGDEVIRRLKLSIGEVKVRTLPH